MTFSAPALPIDHIVPALRRALAGNAAAVLQAEPGAGKTTRVPLALLGEPWLAGRRILLLEPRRLAATNAARYMAGCLGEQVGRTIGYTIRFERCAGPATRIEVVTEGILIRRLQVDPTLAGVGLVIFDEFHERSLHSDLALALCRDAQLGLREDLKLLVMSATLDGAPVARLLGDAPLLSCPGRSHPVTVSWLPRDPKGPIAETAARAVRRAVRENEGDILVFLPGAGEIRRCRELLREAWPADEATVCCLYGELPFAEQERALRPGPRRKVVLATNIAETSLTIDGVQVVIDSGFMRRMRFDADSGLPRLVTVRVTAANAEQRAGRAGRLGPGCCYRLWSAATQAGLLPFAPPQVRGADLTPLALELARWGVRDPAALCWLDAPPAGALAGARTLLRQLAALDDQDRLTPLGEAMAELPAHPRVAALLEAGRRAGLTSEACDLAALLEERDLLRGARHAPRTTDSDLLDRLDILRAWRRRERVPAAVDEAACRAVDRIARVWRRRFKVRQTTHEAVFEAPTLGRLLLVAYPDRLARRRAPGSDRYLLSSGRGARLSPRSGLRDAELLVAVRVGGVRGGDAFIHQASSVNRALLEQWFADRLVRRRRVFWDAEQQRVVACEEQLWGSLVLASRVAEAANDETIAALLDGLRQVGIEALPWNEKARQLQRRVALLTRVFPERDWPDLSDQALLDHLDAWLAPFVTGLRRLADLARLDLAALLRDRLPWPQQRRLEADAPTHVAVPSGHRVALTYGADGPPVLAVKLQELFGLAETPRVAGGRVAVQLHLLSPARRPLAVTQDLRHFWDAVYPEVRREMAGRYPRHPWPDDPWRAMPTRAAKKRKTP